MKYLIDRLYVRNTKRLLAAFLILTSLFTFVTPMQTALSDPPPHEPQFFFDVASWQLEDLPILVVDNPLANTNAGVIETIQVTITSPFQGVNIPLTLTETGPNTHRFESTAIVLSNSTGGFPLNTNATLIINNATLNTDPNTKQTVNSRVRAFDPVTQSFRSDINPFALEETDVNSGVFARKINFTTVTNAAENKLQAELGDVIITENLDNGQGLNYLISPNPNPGVVAIAIVNGTQISASYYNGTATFAASTLISDPSGGARPLLILDSVPIASGGQGGLDRFPPSFTLSRSSIISLPLPYDVLTSILEADAFTPIMPLNYPLTDCPLSINGKGFILSQYANTLETQTANTGELLQLKINLSDSSGIGHVALYTNIPGSAGEIQGSDTYIIYDKGKPIEVTDPHGLFSDVKLTASKEGMKYEFLYNITFAKPMDTSDIIFRTWDEKRNSADTKIFDAIKVVGEPIVDPGVANLALAETADITIPYYKLPQYTIPIMDSDGNLIYYNSFGDLERKPVAPYREPIIYQDSIGRLERHDMKQLYDTIASEQEKANDLMINKFNLDTSLKFVPNNNVKPYDETRRASELALCGISIGCELNRDNKDLMQKLFWQEHLRAEKILKSLYQNNYQDD